MNQGTLPPYSPYGNKGHGSWVKLGGHSQEEKCS